MALVSQQWMRSLQGIDVIWESVGGDMFRTCTKALGQGGRLIIIGMMSQYADGWGASEVTSPVTLTATTLGGCARWNCLPALCQQQAMRQALQLGTRRRSPGMFSGTAFEISLAR